jgi:hypothetical protein
MMLTLRSTQTRFIPSLVQMELEEQPFSTSSVGFFHPALEGSLLKDRKLLTHPPLPFPDLVLGAFSKLRASFRI